MRKLFLSLALLATCLLASPCWADFQVAEGSITQPTSTGNQEINITPGFPPKIVLFFGDQSTADGNATSAFMHFGAMSSTQQYVWGVGEWNNSATSDIYIGYGNDYCTIAMQGTSTFLAKAKYVSMDDDGYTVNWDTVDANERITNYLALGGSDITNVTMGNFNTSTSSGSQSITGIGFQPDLVIFHHVGAFNATGDNMSAPLNWVSTNAAPVIGFATNSTNQAYCAGRKVDAATTMDTYKRQRTGKAFATVGTGLIRIEFNLTSMDADGFTINVNDVDADFRSVLYIAIKGGRHYIGNFDQNTSAGVQPITGIPFQPSGVMLQSFNNAASTSTQNGYRISRGVGVSPSKIFCIWDGSSDNTANSVVNRDLDRANIIKMITEGTPTINTVADFVSNDANGFTINDTTADATSRQVIYWAFGANAVSGEEVFYDRSIGRGIGRGIYR